MGGRTDGRTEDRTNWNDDDDADSIVHMSEGERERHRFVVYVGTPKTRSLNLPQFLVGWDRLIFFDSSTFHRFVRRSLSDFRITRVLSCI